MPFTVDPEKFHVRPELVAGVSGKRVLITGAGKDGGIGQAFALAAGLNGAASVCVHFHRSYTDGFDLVNALRAKGIEAFPLQADVTNMGDLWATRSYVIEQMGGLPPDLVICNSGLTEKGYSFGRALREIEGEPAAVRRARVRQHFIDSLEESRLVLDTKIDGFLAMTHLWAGEEPGIAACPPAEQILAQIPGRRLFVLARAMASCNPRRTNSILLQRFFVTGPARPQSSGTL